MRNSFLCIEGYLRYNEFPQNLDPDGTSDGAMNKHDGVAIPFPISSIR